MAHKDVKYEYPDRIGEGFGEDVGVILNTMLNEEYKAYQRLLKAGDYEFRYEVVDNIVKIINALNNI